MLIKIIKHQNEIFDIIINFCINNIRELLLINKKIYEYLLNKSPYRHLIAHKNKFNKTLHDIKYMQICEIIGGRHEYKFLLINGNVFTYIYHNYYIDSFPESYRYYRRLSNFDLSVLSKEIDQHNNTLLIQILKNLKISKMFTCCVYCENRIKTYLNKFKNLS